MTPLLERGPPMRIVCGLVLIIACASGLGAEPDKPKIDSAGDPLPPGATARFGSAKLRHDAKAVAFLDAKNLVSFGDTLRIWDATSGRMLKEHASESMSGAIAAAFSRDG